MHYSLSMWHCFQITNDDVLLLRNQSMLKTKEYSACLAMKLDCWNTGDLDVLMKETQNNTINT